MEHPSSTQLQAVFDTVLDGLITINDAGVIQSFNKSAERIFGYSAQEVIGQNFMILMPAPHQGDHDQHVKNYLSTGDAKVIGIGREVSAQRKDGSIFPMELSINEFAIDGKRAFVGMIRDITERKRAEEKLLDSDKKMRAIVDNTIDGMITINGTGEIETFNRACEQIFGYAASEVIGKNVKILMPLPYHEEHDQYIRNYHDTGIKKIIGTGREVMGKRKDETVFPLELSVSKVDVSGRTLYSGILRDISARKAIGAEKEKLIADLKKSNVNGRNLYNGILRNISARKAIEAEKEKLIADLKRSNQELDDFAYIASHDLKEPLRGLFNNAKFLSEDYRDKLDDVGVRRLERLGYLCQRMETLVNDLLYYSRLGRQELAIQQTDLAAVIHDIESMLEDSLKHNNVQITICPNLPQIVCDKPRITEVFRNLIVNAIKYNDKPSKLIEVGMREQMSTEAGEEKNVLYVRDNGIGIEEQFFGEIFRIFKRLNVEDDQEKGTGVGLTFVKKIIERHGGRIWLDSEPGQGSTFYFTIRQGRSNAKS